MTFHNLEPFDLITAAYGQLLNTETFVSIQLSFFHKKRKTKFKMSNESLTEQGEVGKTFLSL